MKALRTAPAVLLLALLGCGEPTLDSSDLQASIEDLRDSLGDGERREFDDAIALVGEASRGEVSGTQPFALDGMTARQVLAEAQRIAVRRELALIAETVAAQQEVLGAEQQLARVRASGFVVGGRGEETTATFSVRNGLDTALDSGWLLVEVENPDGQVYAGVEFVAFRPALAPGQQRPLRLALAGDEVRALPPAEGAEVRLRFTSLERGGRVVVEAPDERQRARAEAALAEAEAEQAALEAKLREL